MHGEKNLRRILEHVRRPEGPIDVRAPVFELSRQPAIDYAYTLQNSVATVTPLRHEAMVTPRKRDSHCLLCAAILSQWHKVQTT